MSRLVRIASDGGASLSSTGSDDGFTMVELLVAMSLIVLAVVPLTTVIWRGFGAAAASDHRTDGFSIASREMEAMRSIAYTSIGFYTDQSPPAWGSNTTVILAACSTTCAIPFAPLLLPAGTSTVAGVTYTIARYVYWADVQGVNSSMTSTTFSQAYKAGTVTVTWTDVAGRHTVEQDSVFYPGGLGVYGGPGGGSTTTTSTTAPLVAPGVPTLTIAASQPASPQDQQEIDLTITAPTTGGAVADYVVQWSTDPAFIAPAPAQSLPVPASSLSYPAQNLAFGTAYFFRAYAANASGQSTYSGVVSAATALPVATTTTTTPGAATTTTVGPACNLGGFTITTSTTGKTYLDKNGAMTENLTLSLAVNGSCLATVTASSILQGTSTLDPGAPYQFAGPATGGQWSATVNTLGQTTWTLGRHVMTVLLAGQSANVTQGLLVCVWTPPGQRSSSSSEC